MRKNILWSVLLAVCTVWAVSGSDVLKKVNKKFDNTSTMEINYKQIQKWELAKEESESEGKIYFKKPNHFRIEAGADFVLSDGKTVHRYSKANNQVLIENIKPNDDLLLPGQMFLSFSKSYDLKDYFEKTIDNKNFFVLKLSTKKGEEKFINKITAYINEDFVASKIEYEDLDDNKTTLIMNNIQIDKSIPDDKFIFKAIPKAEVIDLRK